MNHTWIHVGWGFSSNHFSSTGNSVRGSNIKRDRLGCDCAEDPLPFNKFEVEGGFGDVDARLPFKSSDSSGDEVTSSWGF